MGARTVGASILLIALVSCTSGAGESSETTLGPSQASADDPGRLVILDESGDIVVMRPDGSEVDAVTDDAGESARYAQPVWSPDASRLAWGQVTEEGFAVGIQAPGSGDPTTVPTTNLPFYTFWSPDGESLGVLHNGTSGVEFRMVDVASGTSASLDEDTPFYFSWSPDGDRVVTHAGRDRAETITPSGERETLEPTQGGYLSPQWGPTGVFHVVDDHLVIEVDGERRPIVAVTGSTMFVSNPQGTLLALQATGDGSDLSATTEELPTVTTQAVVVVDVETGEAQVVSNGLALGFFWSPDGGSLLVLTTSDSGVVPRVWHADGEAMVFESYFPPQSMLQNTFPFFPQYAQSVSFWAPDSSAFTYAGAVGDEPGIWVQDLEADAPTKVSDGTWVAWSAASS